MSNTLNPQWNQSFIFSPLRPHDLRGRALEVTVWDNDRLGANEFLGEVTLDLTDLAGQQYLHENGEAAWHALNVADEVAMVAASQAVSTNRAVHSVLVGWQ